VAAGLGVFGDGDHEYQTSEFLRIQLRSLFAGCGCPGELVGFAEEHSGAVDDFLGMPPEMRDAVEDGAKPGYIEALDAIKAEQLAGGQMDQYFSGFAYHGVERAQ